MVVGLVEGAGAVPQDLLFCCQCGMVCLEMVKGKGVHILGEELKRWQHGRLS